MNNIIKASQFATAAHSGQTRKGKDIPYITHPLTVGLLLASKNLSEDVVIAGILHDTIEDTDVTYADIEKEFGKKIAEIVNHVTEQDKNLPWAERKQIALEHIQDMSEDAVLVKSADVLHNMTDQVEDYKIEGERMYERFNAPKEAQLQRYEKLIAAFEKKLPENPFLPELKNVFTEFVQIS
jgi:(p)ppGpp synthase/HD superfamily hydrolase